MMPSLLHTTIAALLCLTVAIAARCHAVVVASCQRKCGGVDIPFPFGIESQPGCAKPGFELSCRNNPKNGVPTLVRNVKPLNRSIKVLNILLEKGQVRMKMDMSSHCYNTVTHVMNCVDNGWMDLTESPFTFSDSANKFTAFGCRVLAYLGAGGQSDIGSNLRIGCAASCTVDDLSSISSSSCTGIGCCQTAIPKGIKYYKVWFDDRFNTSDIYNWERCSYAALVEESSFIFSRIYNSSSRFNNSFSIQPPFVLDWAMGNMTCMEAQKNIDSYACISTNSICLDSQNGPGYICNCEKGFQGNPYLKGADGCQGTTGYRNF